MKGWRRLPWSGLISVLPALDILVYPDIVHYHRTQLGNLTAQEAAAEPDLVNML